MEERFPSRIIGNSDRELGPEDMLRMGKAIGQESRYVLVGKDSRPTTDMMYQSFVAGLISTGAKAYLAGTIPLSAMPFNDLDVNCLAYIGSPENEDRASGLDLMNKDGTYFTENQMNRFNDALNKVADNGEKRDILYRPVNIENMYDLYKSRIRSVSKHIQSDTIVDLFYDSLFHNTPMMLNDIRSQIFMVNCHMTDTSMDRIVPHSESDLKLLSRNVKASYGSIGIAINANGTRIAGIDENGGYISGILMFALLMERLKPSSVAMPIDTPMIITDLFKADYTFTPTASQHIGEFTKTRNVKFGGAKDGTFIFPTLSRAPDGIVAASIIADMAAEFGIADYLNSLPKYTVVNTAMRYIGNIKLVMRRVDYELKSIECERFASSDGWRLDYGDGMVFVNLDDVQQTVNVRVESKDKMYSTGLMEIATEAIAKALSSISK